MKILLLFLKELVDYKFSPSYRGYKNTLTTCTGNWYHIKIEQTDNPTNELFLLGFIFLFLLLYSFRHHLPLLHLIFKKNYIYINIKFCLWVCWFVNENFKANDETKICVHLHIYYSLILFLD